MNFPTSSNGQVQRSTGTTTWVITEDGTVVVQTFTTGQAGPHPVVTSLRLR